MGPFDSVLARARIRRPFEDHRGGHEMLKRVLRRVVYFGIPVAMWIAGAACTDVQERPEAPQMTSYRCSRVGCDKRADAAVGAAAPVCACGATMVSDK